MTQEEKAKAYDEAIKRAKKLQNTCDSIAVVGWCKYLFPELKSKAERIKEILIEHIKDQDTNFGIKKWYGFTTEDLIGWLEKQPPIRISKEGEKIRNNIIEFLNDVWHCGKDANFDKWDKSNCSEWIQWLEKQVSITKLSEEEEKELAKSVLTSCATSFINYLDAHKYDGKMCVSNGECEDIENAFLNAMWDRLHRYYCKYIEKQDELKSIDDITSQEAVDIAVAKCFEEGDKKSIETVKPKFKVGDRITNGRYTKLIVGINSDWPHYIFKDGTSERIDVIDDKYHFLPETKFKVGDWIVNKQGEIAHVDSVKEDKYGTLRYYIKFTNGAYTDPMPCFIDEEFHVFTIKDAKAGDVLYSPCCKILFIFKNNKTCYVGYNLQYQPGGFVVNSPICIPSDSIPANKEQCDVLKKAITDAGYKWDAGRKHLEKFVIADGKREIGKCFTDIDMMLKENKRGSGDNVLSAIKMALTDVEEKRFSDFNTTLKECLEWIETHKSSDWTRDDEQYLLVCKNALAKYQTTDKWDASIISQWLENRLKCGSQVTQAWSEEDEIGFADTLWAIQQARTIAKDENDMGNLWYAEDWLKSLKQRLGGK